MAGEKTNLKPKPSYMYLIVFLGFFVLLRFYLRVDNTLIRVHDTRLYHEVAEDTQKISGYFG